LPVADLSAGSLFLSCENLMESQGAKYGQLTGPPLRPAEVRRMESQPISDAERRREWRDRPNPSDPGDPEPDSAARYLPMARVLDDTELAVCAASRGTRRRLRGARRSAYRLFLRELRADIRFVAEQYSNSATTARTAAEIAGFLRESRRCLRRLRWAYFLHGLGIPRGASVARNSVEAVTRLLSSAHV